MRTCGARPSRATGRRRHERFLLGDVMGQKRRKASRTREAFREDVRRRPSLPPRHQGSTIGAEGLSFRVRNGTGRFPFAIVPPKLYGVVASPTDAFVAEDVGVNRPQLGSCTVDA